MKGICFKEPLFHATVEGRKTQTRRIVKPQPQGCFVYVDNDTYEDGHYERFKPRYKVSETVYLTKEKGVETDIFAKITAIRCERLQDISDEDCFREGIMESDQRGVFFSNVVQYGGARAGVCKVFASPQQAYAALINSIYGKGTWESNPWVWIYDYKLTK